ncbi:MAG TPA: hypothetical protein PK395_07750, partial [bacterium]|nr:hypothetical protein [bacterium]
MNQISRTGRPVGPLSLAVLNVLVFLGTGLWYTGGRVAAPLDDTAIHLQYAEQIAHGQYYRYHDGDPMTSGATSWLYAHLLAVFAFVGIHGSVLMAFSILLGGCLFCAVVYYAGDLGSGSRNRVALLLATSGPLLWAFLSGMEIALIAAVMIALLLFYEMENRGNGHFRLTVAAMVVLALVRPEGSFLAAVSVLFVAVRMCDRDRDLRRVFLRVLLPVGAAIVWPNLWTRLSTGDWSSNGMIAKSVFHEPVMTSGEKLAEFSENIRGVFRWFAGVPEYGTWPGEYLPPAALVLAVVGVFAAIRSGQDRNWRRLLSGGVLATLFVIVAALSVATLSVWSLHNYRYLLPVLPVVLVFLGVGIEEIARWGSAGKAVSRALFVLILLTQICALPLWLSRYGRNCGSIAAKQEQMAQWIAGHTDPQATVALNDAGILAMFSKRHTFDLVGLMNNQTTIPYRMGEGALYEYLTTLPEEERFQYYAVFPEWFELFLTFDVLGEPVVRFPDPFEPTFEKVLYRAAWRTRDIDTLPRASALTRPDWELIDRLDVGDLESERAHEYVCEPRDRFPDNPVPFRRNFGYHEEIEQMFPDEKDRDLIPRLAREGLLERFDILDSGRRHNGSERFIVRGLRAGADLAVGLRTCQDEAVHDRFEYQMAVYAGEKYAGTWTIEGTP